MLATTIETLDSMPNDSASRPWCVIGAGPSGLTALKNLLAAGIEAECLEREDDLGGNWYFGSPASSVFASTRLISSKSMTAYTDFPMPREWPAYPHHQQCLDYLRSYARHFNLLSQIRPRMAVQRIERMEPADAAAPDTRSAIQPQAGQGWVVSVLGHAPKHYAGVVIATGHNHQPLFPTIPGTFSGSLLHACNYKSPTQPLDVAGKRVLVIGGGNSACDIAVDLAGHASQTVLSTRRSYFIVPRFLSGRPSDLRAERMLTLGFPLWLRRLVSLRAIDRTIGLPHRHGLQKPDHKLWETHPVVNGQLYNHFRAGSITTTGDVARFDSSDVLFCDGRRERFDLVIYATGYQVSLPLIAPHHLCATAEKTCPRLFLNLLHPTQDDIAVVGLIQPDSGQWGLTDLQSQIVARMAVAAKRAPLASAWLYRQRQRDAARPAIAYLDSPRHRLEVEHFSYRKKLTRLIGGLDTRIRNA